MNNQKNKNEEGIDLSQFPIRAGKESVAEHKGFSFENFKESWQRMGKKNQIYAIFIIIAFVLIIILFFNILSKSGGQEAKLPEGVPLEAPPLEQLPTHP